MFFLAVRRFRLRSDWVQTEGVLDMERDQPGTFFLVTVADCLENGGMLFAGNIHAVWTGNSIFSKNRGVRQKAIHDV